MKNDIHDEVRTMLAAAGDLSDAQQSCLHTHLEQCPECRDYAEAVGQVVGALRSLPVTADSRLVRATQMRVRFHAGRLQETRRRIWLVAISCLGVGFSATLTAPLVWRLFAWMGARAGVSTMVWQTGFLFFFIAPALVVSVLLLARGTFLTHNGERSQQ